MRIKNWVNNFTRYFGDANNDLRQLRLEDERILQSHYVICDIAKPKSIRITNQNLHRDVDVVVASWHDSLEYVKVRRCLYRGNSHAGHGRRDWKQFLPNALNLLSDLLKPV